MKLFIIKIASVFGLFFGLTTNVNCAIADEIKYEVSHSLYEFDASNDYVISDENRVEETVLGVRQLGKLTITGDIKQKTSFRQTEAYGVSGNVSFSYAYDGKYQTDTNTDWNIVSDTCTNNDDQTLSGSMAKGVMIVQKSYDGNTWTNATNPIVNYYEDNKNGSTNFYRSAGNDIFNGVYYRMIFSYELGRKTGTTGALWWEKDVYEYKRYSEVYTCYVAIDTPSNISIHNLSVEDDDLNFEGYSVELLKNGETLNDGDTTAKGFSIDTFDANYLVGVSKNGASVSYVNNGFKATENGKYEITVISKFGTKSTSTIYVFDGGTDRGFKTYFGDYYINGERVYRDGEFPTFAKNSRFHINEIDENTPTLSGKLVNTTTEETITISGSDRSMRDISLSPGCYNGVLYSGNPSNGSFFKYTVNFNILDESSKPYVNYRNLTNATRLCDLGSKHYEVAFQTTKGGYIFVCFSMDSYDNAFRYAYEIEKRFIEKSEDGYLYYKSIENPNKKLKYIDNIELTQALNFYAKRNIEINYFNPLDSFTYRTYENNLLDSLESLNITESIKVFPNKEEKEKMASRMPYLNGFTFISVADYDSSKVTAKCYKTGRTCDIKYDIPLDNQLTTSSKYLITETNKYGKSISYDAYFSNENQTISTWSTTINGVDETINASSLLASSGAIKISGDKVSLVSITNALDQDSIVTIKAPDAYSYEIKCLISELGNLTLYKKGKYALDFIDRIGNSYQMIINISGNARYSEVFSSSSDNLCYTNVYNNSRLNKIGLDEEIIYDSAELKAAIDRVVDADLYTVSSYANYSSCLKAAIEVYNNPNATQTDINNAASNLNNAYNNLVLATDKTMLHSLLTKYENTNGDLYTSASYSNLTKVYNESMLVYLEDNPSEDEVNQTVEKLNNAFASLVLKGDKGELKSKLEATQKVDCNLYTPSSVSRLNDAWSMAYRVYIDSDVSQDQIDAAIKALDDAFNSLSYRADFSKLLDEIKKAQALNKDKYTKLSWDALIEKYNSAIAIYKDFNNSQSDVNVATFNLKQALASLVNAGDSSSLQELVNEVSHIDNRLYTNESIKLLKEKFDEAKIAINEKYEQKLLDKIETELKDLKDSIVIREDKVALKNKLDEILDADKTITDATKHNDLVTAYNDALKVLNDLDASEEDVQRSIKQLNKAINDAQKSTISEAPFDWNYVIIGASTAVGMIIIFLIIKFLRDRFFRGSI